METNTTQEIEFSQIKIYENATVDEHGNWCSIYECADCGYRSRNLDSIVRCLRDHIRQHHKEEAMVGII